MDDFAAPTAPVKPARASLARLWRAGYLIVVVIWMSWLLAGTDFASSGLSGHWFRPQVVLFAAGWSLLPLGLGALWWWLIKFNHHIRLPLRLALHTQALAWAGRYLPGKAGLWLAKLAVIGRHGLSWRQLSHSMLIEQATFVLAGAALAAALMPWPLLLAMATKAGAPGPVGWLSANAEWLPAAGIAVLLAGFAVLVWLLPRSLKIAVPLQPGRWVLLFAGHACLHAVVGLALYPMVALLLPASADALGIAGVVAALAFANVAGIVVMIAPAGLGVREAGLAMVLALAVPYSEALAFAALARLISFLADLAFSVVGWLIGRRAGFFARR